MARGRTKQMMVQRCVDGSVRRGPDDLIVEEPLEIHLDGHIVSTTMRTPGHDFELAIGFVHAEGLLHGVPITGVRYCGTGSAAATEFNVVTVETGQIAPIPVARLTATSSSCGLCGSSNIEQLCERLIPIAAAPTITYDVLATVSERVRSEQSLFARTGAVHAAAAFGRHGVLLVVREDIGRHNAVDKVVGRLLLDGQLPATSMGLFVSGRASFEMVQKAWAAGFGTVIAVSAPSSLAVETARRGNLTLVGFVRDATMNVYSPA